MHIWEKFYTNMAWDNLLQNIKHTWLGIRHGRQDEMFSVPDGQRAGRKDPVLSSLL